MADSWSAQPIARQANFWLERVLAGSSTFTQPTCARFAHDGRVIVAEKAGKIKVRVQLAGGCEPPRSCSTSLLSFALDPTDFHPSHAYIHLYAFYAYDPNDSFHDSCASLDTPCKASGRVSRPRIVGTKVCHLGQIAIRSMAAMRAAFADLNLVVASHGARFGCQHPGQRFIHKAARPLQHAAAFPRRRCTATSFCANLSNGGRPDDGMRDPANASESCQSEEPPMSPLPVTPQKGKTINIIIDEDPEELQEYELRFLDAANFDRLYFVNDDKALFKDGESPGISDYDALEDGATYYLRASRGDNIGHVVRSERERATAVDPARGGVCRSGGAHLFAAAWGASRAKAWSRTSVMPLLWRI
eukprot:jgi/Chlat1/5496/Chrsp360S05327